MFYALSKSLVFGFLGGFLFVWFESSEGFREPWSHPPVHIPLLLFHLVFRISMDPIHPQAPQISLPPSFSFRFGFFCFVACQIRLMVTGVVDLTLYRMCTGKHARRGTVSAKTVFWSIPPHPPALPSLLRCPMSLGEA